MEFTRKYFDPANQGGVALPNGTVAFRNASVADARGSDLYIYTQKAILALNVALATGRPLLISGEPGSGKSTMAGSAAAVLGWWYYKHVVTSRTQAADLLSTFDSLQRLNDASANELLSRQHYVEPGVLWWAFDSTTAQQRGTRPLAMEDVSRQLSNPGMPPGLGASTTGKGGPQSTEQKERVVVLLDEIDKADPDVPNDLLDPFDLKSFTVRETNDPIVATRDVLLILTTNGERELPPAFLRRCVTLSLDRPDETWFVDVANQKFGTNSRDLHLAVAKEVMALRQKADGAGLRRPSTAEYLDALAVCQQLGITPTSSTWSEAVDIVLWKYDRPAQALSTALTA